MCWITTKPNYEPSYQYIKFLVIELVLTDKRNLSGTRPKSACGKFSSCREKCHYQSYWVRNFRFFFSHFGFLSPLGKFKTSLSVSDTDFQCSSSHNPKQFLQTTLDWERWRLCRSFINLTEWRERRVTCQQLNGDIKHVKNYLISSGVFLRLFSRLEILV